MRHNVMQIDRRDIIDGLGRGLKVMEAFDMAHPRLTPSEVADYAQMTRTAARRYLLSLVHFGYADSDGKRFWLQPRVLRLGQNFLGSARLPRLVQPVLQQISQHLGENVNASVLDDHDVIYLARSPSQRGQAIGFPASTRVPAHLVTPGVVILSTYPEEVRDAWIDKHLFTAQTPHTLTDPDRFREHVRTAGQLGYWITDQQLEIGQCGLAVPVRDGRGDCHGALSLTFPSDSYSSRQILDHLLPSLQEASLSLRALI